MGTRKKLFDERFVKLPFIWICAAVLAVEAAERELKGRPLLLNERTKRFVGVGSPPPQFMFDDYIVSETNGTLRNHVCVLPGSELVEVQIFSAFGPQSRCFRFPCPPATENVDFKPVNIFGVFLKPPHTFCFDITILDDNILDGREFFLLVLQDLRSLQIIDTTVVTINDDDDPSFVEPSGAVGREDVGDMKICVMGGKEDTSIIINVLPESSTASMAGNNPDFAINFIRGEEVFLRAGGNVCFDITVIDDQLTEPIEVVKVSITQGRNSSAMFYLEEELYIVDNDVSPQFDRIATSYSEDVGQFEVCVSFSGDPSQEVRCRLAGLPITAYGTIDYVPILVNFDMVGQTQQCHQVQIIDDEVPEGMESFRLVLFASNSELPPVERIINIIDNDYLEFEGSSKMYTIGENETSLELCVVYAGGNLTTTIHGYIITQAISARSRDFIGISRFFPLTNTDRRCFNVTIRDDPFPEPREEFRVFVFTLGSTYREFITIVIEDDDEDIPY